MLSNSFKASPASVYVPYDNGNHVIALPAQRVCAP